MWRLRASSLSDLQSQMKEAREAMEQDENTRLLMEGLRGTNLNDDDQAAEGLEMKIVEVQGGDELPLSYDPKILKEYFSKRPDAVIQRSLQIFGATGGVLASLALDSALGRNSPDMQVKRTAQLRDALTSLGPFFIKIGQALSIRPDILPPRSMVELQKLCDKVPSFDSRIAMKTIEDELGAKPDEIFSELTAEPVAAASLGQVYKGKLRSTGEQVAVKVQRPFVLETVSLDLHLMRELGLLARNIPFLAERTDLADLVDEFASRFYDELDYNLECENGIKIAEHMKHLPLVKIPKNYPEFTARRVHTAEWVEGEKLSQSTADDVGDLVNVGVITYLTQLLEEGFFHADPHAGNLIRTPDGRLCVLDFGLMTEITDDQKYGMIEAIVHLINRDYVDIGRDFKKLDFIPESVDVEPIVPALTRVFDSALAGGGAKSINFQELAGDLATITFDYPFRIPPYFALVIRAIGVLEGIALVGNPDFAIIDEAFPYIAKRLLTDDSPRLREALRYMVYGRDGVFDAARLLEILEAFEQFDVVRTEAGGVSYGGGSGGSALAATTMEAERVSASLKFFFSDEGLFFRDFILDETVRSADVLTRQALLQLVDLPGPAGIALRPLRTVANPVFSRMVPELSEDEERTVRSTRAILDFFLNRGQGGGLGNRDALNGAVDNAQRLAPVFREYSAAMQEFGLKVVQRLTQKARARAVDYGLDVILGPRKQQVA